METVIEVDETSAILFWRVSICTREGESMNIGKGKIMMQLEQVLTNGGCSLRAGKECCTTNWPNV
jgi:hypothetical protein